jgi:hypothetical protein
LAGVRGLEEVSRIKIKGRFVSNTSSKSQAWWYTPIMPALGKLKKETEGQPGTS